MKVFDYFYENYYLPLVEDITEVLQTICETVLKILNWLLIMSLFVTIPVWLIPYLVMRDKRENHFKNKGKRDIESGTEKFIIIHKK